MTKTQFQRNKEKRHDKVVRLFRELDGEGCARSALFEELSARTGYTRQGIYLILRRRGVDYTAKRKGGEAKEQKTKNRR